MHCTCMYVKNTNWLYILCMYLYFKPFLSMKVWTSSPTAVSPLSFIFNNTAYLGQEGIFNKVILQKGEYRWAQTLLSLNNWLYGHTACLVIIENSLSILCCTEITPTTGSVPTLVQTTAAKATSFSVSLSLPTLTHCLNHHYSSNFEGNLVAYMMFAWFSNSLYHLTSYLVCFFMYMHIYIHILRNSFLKCIIPHGVKFLSALQPTCGVTLWVTSHSEIPTSPRCFPLTRKRPCCHGNTVRWWRSIAGGTCSRTMHLRYSSSVARPCSSPLNPLPYVHCTASNSCCFVYNIIMYIIMHQSMHEQYIIG